MTDLEKHVNQPGRAKLVKRVREKIVCLPASKNVLLTSRGIGYRLDP